MPFDFVPKKVEEELVSTLTQWRRNGEKVEVLIDAALDWFKLMNRVVYAVRNELNKP